MYGKVIGTSIAVDCFDEVTENGIYFLTEGYLKQPLPAHVDRLYTSPHNGWLLRTRYKVDPEKIVNLPINEKLLIQDQVKNLDFYVTLMDSKQKPGAVMFLFEGDGVGNVLYAGKCCYSENFISRPLCNFLKLKMVDYLYVHDACEDCHSHSMSASAAVQEVISIVRWNANCRVLINEPCFREDILTELRENFGKAICVSENIMVHLESVGRGSDFILDRRSAKVFITDQPLDKKSHDGRPEIKIILIPCSMKRSSQEIQVKLYNLEKKGYYVILYRNHCSPPELVSLVRDINARHTVLIRPTIRKLHPTHRTKNLDFWSHLGNFKKFIEFFERLQNDDEQILSPVEVNDTVNCIEETENAVAYMVEDEFEKSAESNTSNDDVHLVAPSPDSVVLVESDLESIVSKDTVLNTKMLLEEIMC